MKNAQFWIGPVVTGEQTQAQLEALTYVKVKDVGTIGELGSTEEIAKFSPLEGTDKKVKGNVDAGDVSVTWGRDYADPGQIATKDAGLTTFCYAVKFVLNDNPTANHTKTSLYSTATITEAKKSGGSGNDVITEKTMVNCQQRLIEVVPALIP